MNQQTQTRIAKLSSKLNEIAETLHEITEMERLHSDESVALKVIVKRMKNDYQNLLKLAAL